MEYNKNTLIVLAVVLGIIGFAAGHFLFPAEVETIVEVEVESEPPAVIKIGCSIPLSGWGAPAFGKSGLVAETLEEIINEPVTNNSIITSVKQISNNNNNIYPNPSCGYFTITNNEFTITNVEITDITGRTIYNSEPVTRNSQFVIDISDQPKGIYFINITCEDQIQTKTEKIIIK